VLFRSIESQHTKRTSVVAHDRVRLLILPFDHGRTFNLFYKLSGRLPRPIQHLLMALLNRTRDPEPETYDANRQDTREKQGTTWGWLPGLALINALGMLLAACSFVNAQDSSIGLRTFLYPGLLLIYIPTVIRLISPATARTERIGLICIAGFCFYIIKVMSSPLYFSYSDEFLHWLTADNITTSGHLFSKNALMPVSSYYPGLEIVTNALGTLSGLDIFNSGLIVIGVARLLMILILFVLNEQILKSARLASIATILYMANPHYFLHDSQFAYESLALPLAILVLSGMVSSSVRKRVNKQEKMSRLSIFTGWVVLVALTLTHHLTNFFLDGFLVLWAIIYGFLHHIPIRQSSLARTALVGVLMSVAWIGFNGNPVVHYIATPILDSLNELRHILTNTNDARPLFTTYGGGQSALLWERLVMALSITLILLCLPFGWLCLWQRYRSNTLICTFGIISLFYPFSQVFRFTHFGPNLTDRAAAFLFIPITSILAIFITQFWPTRRLDWKQSSLLVCAMSVIFLGGFIIGAGPGLSELPGPYEFSDPRGIGLEGIQAAIWTSSHLGTNNRIGTDALNQILEGTFGNQYPVTSVGDHIDVSPIFFSLRLGPQELSVLRKAQVHYLVVDQRLARTLTIMGIYFVEVEPNAFHHTTPIDLEALTKFNTIPSINRVFDSGNIVIYDVGELTNAPEKR